MLYIFMLVLQIMVSLLMGLYFMHQLRSQRGSETRVRLDSPQELENLRRLRAVHLNLPLSEQVRPKAFSDIVGQEEGIAALQAVLCGPNPQHVLIYGPPGVGKTCAARLVLEEAKRRSDSPFCKNAPFVEMDATCVRFDERAIADPLIGSVHDPIYQGAGPLGVQGVPQPKPGAVTKAHGGVLFLDEIGELHPLQMNKLLKILEDRKVMLESAYYSPSDHNIPRYIHDVFQNGLPADFRLVGATTRGPEDIPPALRSRCIEIFFKPLNAAQTAQIARNCAKSAGFQLEKGVDMYIGSYSAGGRDAANLVQVAAGIARNHGCTTICIADVEYVLRTGAYMKRPDLQLPGGSAVGKVYGLAVSGAGEGRVLPIVAAAFAHPTGQAPHWQATGIVDRERLRLGSKTVERRSTAAGALENVRSVLRGMGVAVDEYDVHLDFPGGMPVDGPSAGAAMAAAVYSAITGRRLSGSMALTGELGLDGSVLPVGGVPAKVEAALQAGAQLVLIPRDNWQQSFEGDPRVRVADSFEQALDLLLAQLPALPAAPVELAEPTPLLAAGPELSGV